MELKDDDVVVSLMPILNTDGQEEETETTQ